MVVSKIATTAGELVEDFIGASPEQLAPRYSRLTAAAWRDERPTELALAVARQLVLRFGALDEDRQGRAAVLLGLLLEAPDEPQYSDLEMAVAGGCDKYLCRFEDTRNGQPLFFALLYLLAHFPDRRAQVLAAVRMTGIDPDDRSRLDRALQRLDPDHPDLGRAFPYPEAWRLDDDERSFDQAWIETLSPAEVRLHWDNDTETVLGHLGAKAYWSVLNGAPTVFRPDPTAERVTLSARSGSSVDLFSRHLPALRCRRCPGRLSIQDGTIVCVDCARVYPAEQGILDMTAVDTAVDRSQDFLFKLAEMPTMGYFYETYARPNFLRLCGANWDSRVTPADEDVYIAKHVRPVDGPVLDLAAGAGRWTSVLERVVGADRLIALDLGLPMLAALRDRLPLVPAVLAGADSLPFGDATLGAVMCWNALQAFPAQAPAAIAEVGRCLRPGGSFTLLTFRNSDDPVYRHFVSRHHFPQHATGLHLFEHADILDWIEAAGMTVREEDTPGTFVMITAERNP